MDGILIAGWKSFASTQLAQWDMLEAYIAGGSFAIWIIMFRLMDQMPSLRKYRMSQKEPVGLFVPDQNNSWLPLVIYIVAIHTYHIFVTKPPISEDPPTLSRTAVETIFGIFYYDFIFFWLHWAMHSFHIVGNLTGHHVHHTQNQLCASEVQHHSFVDGTLQVIVNMFVQNSSLPWYGRKHYLSRLLHNVIVTYMLTEIHAGYDGFWSMHNLLPWLVGGAKRHEMHHHNGTRYFQQFFMFLDDALLALTTDGKQAPSSPPRPRR